MRTKGTDPEWIVVSNVDLSLDPVTFVATLQRQGCPGLGVIAPRITSSLSRRELNPYMVERPSALTMHFYKLVFHYYPSMLLYETLALLVARVLKPFRGGRRGAGPFGRAIYAPHGCFIVFSREYFRKGGTLEHPPFLFGEEISVAEAARLSSLQVRFCPELHIEHSEHASIGALSSRRIHRFLAEASAYCADRFFTGR